MPVTFQAEGHRYTNEHGVEYTSVTTLIKKYAEPFDSEYWSLYKAIKLVLEMKGEWSDYKYRAGGWDRVVDYYKKQINFPYKDEVAVVKQRFLYNWKQKGKAAAEAGTAYHKKMEDETHSKGAHLSSSGNVVKVYSGVDLLRYQNFEDDGIYTELLLYNDHFKLAGQADKVIKQGRDIEIRDYKTSEKISQEAFMERTYKAPLKHIPDCDFWKFALQLSTYAWMLEIFGYHIGRLVVEHVPDNHREYELPYLRNEIKALLTDYGNSKNLPAFRFPENGKEQSSYRVA